MVIGFLFIFLHMLEYIIAEIQSLYNPERAIILQKFFQTHDGGYGEWDKFLGMKIPLLRQVARKYSSKLSMSELIQLLHSDIHEIRFVALVIMNARMKSAKFLDKKWLLDLYLANTKFVNNRDLVDISAPNIVWYYFRDKFFANSIEQSHQTFLKNIQKDLTRLSKSNLLRDRRIAIVATLFRVRKWILSPSLRVAKILLTDPHSLIHKAVGWVLREVGKVNIGLLRGFLDVNYSQLNRTTLCYAIEKMSPDERQSRLKK